MDVTKVRFGRERLEKRGLSRFKGVDFHVTSSVVDVVLRDLNCQGMSIETRRPLRVGASYPFKIREGRESVALTGRVKWCRLLRMIDIGGGESQALYRAGVAFSRPLDDFLPPVESVAARFRMPSEPAPPAGALERRPPRRSSLKCPDCGVPALVGAQRCGICGSLLPQR